jgi:CubicO group peptidase (beta-lactamase class C family)
VTAVTGRGRVLRVGGGVFLLAACAPTRPPSPAPLNASRAARYTSAAALSRQSVESLRQLAGIPGISVAVGIGDSIVWSEGFGHADLEARTPVTRRTRFRIASVSKVLTAAAVGRLHEQGVLDLDAPIGRYVPTWPVKDVTPTVRQLAGHLGGIRDYSRSDVENGIDARQFASVRDALAIFQDDPLIAAPGSAYKYSTFGYVLLSAVLEGASGRSFLDLMEQEVLAPLNMRETIPKLPDRPIPALTALYAVGEGGSAVRAVDVSPSYKWAAGGYVSTAEDLVRFGLAHLRSGFLKDGTRSTLFMSQRTSEGRETGVGIGWMTARDPWGRPVLFHNGTQTGARSVLMLYPDAGLVVAILSNLTNTPQFIEGTAMGIAAPFLRSSDPGESATVLPALAGTYEYRIGSGTQTATGTVQLASAPDRLEGWMSTAAGARVNRLSIPFLLAQGGEARGVIVAPEGLLLLTVQEATSGPAATITFHGGLASSRIEARLQKTRQVPPYPERALNSLRAASTSTSMRPHISSQSASTLASARA